MTMATFFQTGYFPHGAQVRTPDGLVTCEFAGELTLDSGESLRVLSDGCDFYTDDNEERRVEIPPGESVEQE
jgi:hypothetical protein